MQGLWGLWGLWGKRGGASSAAVRHFQKVVDSETERVGRTFLVVRLALALVMLLLHMVFGVVDELPDFLVTLPLWCAFFVVASVLFWAGRGAARASRTVRMASPFAIAFLDIPTVAADHLLSLPHVASPAYAIGVLPGILSLLVVLAAFSLRPAIIVAAAASSSVSTLALHARLASPPSEVVVHLMPPVGAALLAVFLLRRWRLLVAEARKGDLMGKYILGAKLGTGGMAEVFRATYAPEGGFEREVALKRILPAYADDKLFVDLFRREAELGSSLAHPNLVRVLDFGRHEQSWFLALELVDGPVLSSLLRVLRQRGEQIPMAACLHIAQGLAQALAYLHELPGPAGAVGIVHRDVNPPNVLLSSRGDVKLGDFGVARWRGSSTLTTTGSAVRGKIGYMAPEQLEGEQPTPAWDVFAFGLTLHELLSCRRAVTARDEAGAMKQILEARFPPIDLRRPDVPAPLAAVVTASLSREPARRPSAQQVLDAIRTCLAEGGPSGREALALLVAGRGGEARARDDGDDEADDENTQPLRTSRPADATAPA